MSEVPLVARLRDHAARPAVRSGEIEWTYGDLLRESERVARALLGARNDLAEARVAFLAAPGAEYFASLLGIWRAGGIAMPLSLSAPPAELARLLTSAGVETVLATAALRDRLPAETASSVFVYEELPEGDAGPLPRVEEGRRAMMLYTSGTTSLPKGVVTTHANVRAQIEALVTAWEWRAEDRIPLFLPMHHIHGIINIAGCALWSGATIEVFPRFDLPAVLGRVAENAYSLFMAVPTIYARIVEALDSDAFPSAERERIVQGFAALRLMVSGSAALPPSMHGKWERLTGQRLLERYGMTETGMTLSNPLRGERRAGSVGRPLPTVEVRLKDEEGRVISAEGEPGEIQVRGPGIFLEYWNDPAATAEAFDEGWFRTGDLAVVERGAFRIMGRLSVDVIKSGGYKLSALEIEAALLEHPAIRECAVVGVPDPTWGEVVATAVVPNDAVERPDLAALRKWSESRLSGYKLPRRLLWVDALPRNAMGKVQKRAVGTLFETAG